MSNKAEKYYKLYDNDDAATAAEAALVAGVAKWEDPDFKADGSSLYKDPFHPPRGAIPPDVVDWLRINSGEIAGCSKPVTFADGTSAGDVIQGQLGNCWFISAMSVLASHKEYVDRNFVSDLNRSKGIYTFKFFKQGQWRYVHIDDRIPCDRKGRPIYAHGKDVNETWVMILEKAYAKLHGCYDNLKTGYIDYGLRDLTGGACIKFKWTDKPTAPLVASGELFNMVKAALEEGSLAGCSFNTGDEGATESDRGDGILAGHAYGILKMKVVESNGDTFKMVQCRNPWGMSEWRGDWSDNDVMWSDYPEVKEALNPGPFENDGTFWIEWNDFKEQYNQVFLCYDFPDTWSHLLFVGAWDPSSATNGHGGCPKHPTFPANPQYTFTLAAKTTLVLSLAREDYRWRRGNAQYDSAVGFVIMTRNADRVQVFNPKHMKAMAPSFAKATFISLQTDLDAGDYAIIPCCFDPGKEVESFMLEVHSSAAIPFVQKGVEIQDIDAGLKDATSLAATLAVDAPSTGPFVPQKAIKPTSLDAANSLFDTPKEKAAEPEEEGRGLKILHTLVGDLAAEMKSLTQEIATLEARMAKLEAARRR